MNPNFESNKQWHSKRYVGDKHCNSKHYVVNKSNLNLEKNICDYQKLGIF